MQALAAIEANRNPISRASAGHFHHLYHAQNPDKRIKELRKSVTTEMVEWPTHNEAAAPLYIEESLGAHSQNCPHYRHGMRGIICRFCSKPTLHRPYRRTNRVKCRACRYSTRLSTLFYTFLFEIISDLAAAGVGVSGIQILYDHWRRFRTWSAYHVRREHRAHANEAASFVARCLKTILKSH